MKGFTPSPGAARAEHRLRRTASSRHLPLQDALEQATTALLTIQANDGHWVGELQGDTILESEYILLMAFLGREAEEGVRKAARYILSQQADHGAWSCYPDGPPDLSVSVKAYFALKLSGLLPEDAPPLREARELIRSLGGASQCNSFTKFYLALLGQIPYSDCPAVPPELVLLPRWFYINLHAMSAWTRTIVVPLSIFYAHKPCRSLRPEQGIAELFVDTGSAHGLSPARPGRLLTWGNFFRATDWLIKQLDGWKVFAPIRRRALSRAVAWMREHFRDSDGVGAIYPPIVYTIICLKCLGVAEDDPEMLWALQQLEDLKLEDPDSDSIRLQPCFSPVWDTALALNALAEVRSCPDLPPGQRSQTQRAIERASRWLIEREVRQPGDWSVVNPHLEPGGWFFEYRNAFYPDTDDTAMVLMGLARTAQASSSRGRPAAERGVRWLLGMQNRDGGWAAFDRDINREVLTQVPFADHNAMLDPSCPDITARVLEALGCFGYRVEHPQVQRALGFLHRSQEASGAWPGRWGVNYLYGTWQVLSGLSSIGHERDSPIIRQAVDWLLSVQQPGGGWGESCASYDDPRLAGQGMPTASQTSWALLGLMASLPDHFSDSALSPRERATLSAVRQGIDYLLRTQRPDGTWHEEPFTGTGFPRVFYLKYHLYPLYFPLMALARFRQLSVGSRTWSESSALEATETATLVGLYQAPEE